MVKKIYHITHKIQSESWCCPITTTIPSPMRSPIIYRTPAHIVSRYLNTILPEDIVDIVSSFYSDDLRAEQQHKNYTECLESLHLLDMARVNGIKYTELDGYNTQWLDFVFSEDANRFLANRCKCGRWYPIMFNCGYGAGGKALLCSCNLVNDGDEVDWSAFIRNTMFGDFNTIRANAHESIDKCWSRVIHVTTLRW